VAGITATMVGLGNVTNTSDSAKPVSTAQQTALDLKANLASPTFTGTVVLPAAQIVNGVTLSNAGASTVFLNGTGAYSTPAGGSGITRIVASIATGTTAGATASTDYVFFVTGTTTLTLPTAVGNTNKYTVKSVQEQLLSLVTEHKR